ncbi:mitochondrial ATP synthase g subunit-domain-containing protein [Polychytrium aggregatum]|uniref:mitochondrial ATP synthase g subunit-domain-containing protein n=1 Tax=Polychytrium aggregatum TaxID=110093 RepID=UPI0022FE5446|nr:mitochondrial ATP synthase g subunit-domain-containing protein [Polychytrium aggregatum]KAI9197085.1 mitochondrial ATP synthase g subunit-domain-containing protein [Polychytrium aggregatum]
MSPARFLNKATAVSKRFASTTPSAEAIKNQAAGVAKKVNGIVDPLVYYGRVGVEFVSQVFTHAKVTIPNPAAFGEASQGITNFVQSFSSGTWKKITVKDLKAFVSHGIQIVGFFAVGEMVGRRSVIGYDIPGNDAHGDHH